jgi:hypothetical protein
MNFMKVSCAHVAAGGWVIGERQVTPPNGVVHHGQQNVRFASYFVASVTKQGGTPYST